MAELRQLEPTTKAPHFATLLVMALAPEEVGQRIARARKARGWTHDELALRIGQALGKRVNTRTVQRWQKGRAANGKPSLPRLGTLMELADLFELPRSYFVEDEDPEAAVKSLREQMAVLAQEVAALRRDLNGRAPDAPDK